MENELFNEECKDCIEEMATGRRFDTEMVPVQGNELKALNRKAGWEFKWYFHNLVNREETVFKLIVKNDPKKEIQGLVSFRPSTGFIWVGLVENAPHNKGQNRQYGEVFKNMYAFVGLQSFKAGFDGYMAFKSKSLLNDHYRKEVGAKLLNFRHNIMEIDTENSFMEDREEQLKSFEREDFIISNQVVNTPEETARCIKIMEEVMAKRKAKQLIPVKKVMDLF